jgi:surfeit locus 1 family protein
LTLFSVMRRPKWIGALLLALFVAAIFAALSQWQLQRAIESGQVPAARPTEQVMPLSQLTAPAKPVYDEEVGQIVRVSGHFESADYGILASRLNDGTSGYWVIGHFTTDYSGSPALAVAVGWSADRDAAETVRERLTVDTPEDVTIQGRYIDPDAPDVDDAEKAAGKPYDLTTMSTAALVNIWTALPPDTDVYGGYVVQNEAPSGLTKISSPPPTVDVQLNWLNIFYAAEWVVFAGFAVFLWYRLARDAWEREREEAAEAEAAAAAAAAEGTADSGPGGASAASGASERAIH